MEYDAFISYSHRSDRDLARSLEQTLWTFGRTWYQLRRIRTFRDESNLAAEPRLWESIRHAVLNSGCFLLLASPDAARSEWVGKEIQLAAERGIDRVCIVLTDGVLPWTDDVTPEEMLRRPDAALGEYALGVFERHHATPLVVDLRRFRQLSHNERSKDPEFLSAVAALGAKILNLDKEQVWGEFHRAQRLRSIFLAAVSILLIGIAGLLAFSLRAQIVATQREAEQRKIAENEGARASRAQRAVEGELGSSHLAQGNIARGVAYLALASFGEHLGESPEFRQLLSFWVPALVPVDEELSRLNGPTVIAWQKRNYFVRNGKVTALQVPAVKSWWLSADKQSLLLITAENRLVVLSAGSLAQVASLSLTALALQELDRNKPTTTDLSAFQWFALRQAITTAGDFRVDGVFDNRFPGTLVVRAVEEAEETAASHPHTFFVLDYIRGRARAVSVDDSRVSADCRQAHGLLGGQTFELRLNDQGELVRTFLRTPAAAESRDEESHCGLVPPADSPVVTFDFPQVRQEPSLWMRLSPVPLRSASGPTETVAPSEVRKYLPPAKQPQAGLTEMMEDFSKGVHFERVRYRGKEFVIATIAEGARGQRALLAQIHQGRLERFLDVGEWYGDPYEGIVARSPEGRYLLFSGLRWRTGQPLRMVDLDQLKVVAVASSSERGPTGKSVSFAPASPCFVETSAGVTLFCLDAKRGRFTVERRVSLGNEADQEGGERTNVLFVDLNRALVWTSSELSMIDLIQGSVIWSRQLDFGTGEASDYGSNPGGGVRLSHNGDFVVAFGTSQVALFSTQSGLPLSQGLDIAELPRHEADKHKIVDANVAPNGSVILSTSLGRYQRQPPLGTERLGNELREITRLTGFDGPGGMTPVASLAEIAK